jgi:hypothetical protein
MTYLVKSPVNKNVKFAHVYMTNDNATYSIAGSSTSDKYISFDGINASSGISLSLSAGNLVLGNKNYVIYTTPCIFNSHPTGIAVGISNCYTKLLLNDIEIPNQIYGGRYSSTVSTGNGSVGPRPSNHSGYCTFSSNQGDVLKQFLSANNGSTSITYLKEIGQNGLISSSQTAHSMFIWEIDK